MISLNTGVLSICISPPDCSTFFRRFPRPLPSATGPAGAAPSFVTVRTTVCLVCAVLAKMCAAPACKVNCENLFTKIKIGRCELKNRFAMAPMGPLGLGDAEGGWNQRGIDYYTRRAQGGTGLIITGVTFSDNQVETQSMPNCPSSTYNPVQFVRTSREMTERVHAYGARIFLQMSGGFGRVTIPTNLGEFPPVAPSAIPHRWLNKTCRPLTVDEIHG